MTNRETLLALADRVEALTGPSREVDLAIATETRKPQPSDKFFGKRQAKVAKPFTASLDAAMTMMPEGWLVVSLSDLGLAGGCMCRLGNPGTSQDAMSDCGVRTLTLALTAACLRARSM